MDLFLYDREIRHDRVKGVYYYIVIEQYEIYHGNVKYAQTWIKYGWVA